MRRSTKIKFFPLLILVLFASDQVTLAINSNTIAINSGEAAPSDSNYTVNTDIN
jgi:hypothetical protein